MSNFLDPAILFFIFGVMAGLLKSNLEIPQQVSRFLSLYLLMALGLKGGFALNHSGITAEISMVLGTAILLAVLIPVLAYFLLSHQLNKLDAAAIAATYGSISAVTFITASQVLDQAGIGYGAYMAAAMALMESPAIILAIVLANKARVATSVSANQGKSLWEILHESFTDGGQILLLGSMLVGYLSGDAGHKVMAPFSIDLFKGMLSFFLLDMGLQAAKSFGYLKNTPKLTIVYALVAPFMHASIALAIAKLFGFALGETVLLMVLAASASYIAVPAVLRHALPEVKPALYMGMSLGLTFPLNILIGIPVYTYLAKYFIAGA
ncbi:MAG: sodium-dependent bicarbonate transport family permease [Candidatus Methylopumilus sp.]